MPTYEYVCRNCGHRLEAAQSFSDPHLTICDECGGELRKLFTPPAIAFKGSGFYATDHGKKSKPSKKPKTETPPTADKADRKKPESKDAGSKTTEGASS